MKLTTIRRALRFCVLAALAATLTACSSKPDWTEYQHPSGRLTIRFPTATTPAGNGSGTGLRVLWNKTTFAVSWADADNLTEEDFMKEVGKGAEGLGTVKGSAKVSADGLRGMEYTLMTGDGPAFARYLRKENRIYLLLISGPKLDPAAEIPQAFLASFSAS